MPHSNYLTQRVYRRYPQYASPLFYLPFLMCYDRLEFHVVEVAHGLSFSDRSANELKQLKALEDDGLVAVDDQEIRVTPSGRLLLRSIAMVFDRHLASTANDGRFSKAI